MTTDNSQELDHIVDMHEMVVDNSLDGIFDKMGYTKNTDFRKDAIRLITDWHNRQVEEVIKKPHILPKGAQHQESVKQGINFYHRQMRKRVDKLKEKL